METISRSYGNAICMAIIALAMSTNTASGQISTACTSSLISSFAPCLNFVMGSSNGGGSPTAGCCDALAKLISSSADCTCLILTGGVPLNIPAINRSLSISLPRLCNSRSVPLQCKASASPLPGPGPVAYAPGLPALPPSSSGGVEDAPPAAAPAQPVTPPAVADAPGNAGFNQGQRPLLQLPNSAAKLSPTLLLVIVLGTVLVNKF